MFDFGKQLKNLRKTKGLTQEQTAELLNVSKQAVSRWENNITYPDVAFLPILASFYCVTVDFLLGADYEKNRLIQQQYFAKRQAAHHVGDMQTAFDLSQELYSCFPNEKAIINNMMVDSYLMGLHNRNGKKKHYLEMSIFISERFLKMTEDIEESCRCIRNISTCHKLLGNQEIAVSWMKKLPSMWSGIEHTALSVLEGQERADSIACSLDAVLNLMYRLLYASAENPSLTTSQRISVLTKIPVLFQLLFENEDYGFYHSFLCRTYTELAKCYLQDSEKAVKYVVKAAEHAQKAENALPSKHTSILFVNQDILPEEWTRGTNTEKTVLIHTLESAEFDTIRKHPEINPIYHSLKEEGNRL